MVTAWDMKMFKPIYELSSGNNSVEYLGWHDETTTLFATTQCYHIDRFHQRIDYMEGNKKRRKKERK